MKLSLLFNKRGNYDHLRNKNEEGLETYENMKRVNRNSTKFFFILLTIMIIGASLIVVHEASLHGITVYEQLSIWDSQFFDLSPQQFTPHGLK